MKTKPMSQQLNALERSARKREFALLMDQGTGKTWTTLADVERLYAAGLIDALFVLAPKGVHVNWVKREIPTHLEVPVIAEAWRGGAGKKWRAAFDKRLFTPRAHGEVPPLRVLAMNYDAVITKDGGAVAEQFLRCTKAMMVLDESHRIKNPTARRTKVILALRDLAVARRILSGTAITNAPQDLFCQFSFLKPGSLGTTSYRAFVAEFCELVPQESNLMKALVRQNPRNATAQIIAKDEFGRPKYKNLDKLRKLIEPWMFRVLKRDCLDLPPKVYQTHFYELSTPQRRAYELMEEENRIELPEPGEVVSVKALAAISKLQQIAAGFVILPDKSLQYVEEGNGRLDALEEVVEDIEGKFIVWARFREELRAVAERLRKMGKKVVEYHGGVNDRDREAAIDAFQNGDADAFVGQQQSAGIGLTLTAASTAVYFSQDYSSENRKQSEDRCHRIGTTGSVLYIDIAAEDTIDEKITRALQQKSQLAATVLDSPASGKPPR